MCLYWTIPNEKQVIFFSWAKRIFDTYLWEWIQDKDHIQSSSSAVHDLKSLKYWEYHCVEHLTHLLPLYDDNNWIGKFYNTSVRKLSDASESSLCERRNGVKIQHIFLSLILRQKSRSTSSSCCAKEEHVLKKFWKRESLSHQRKRFKPQVLPNWVLYFYYKNYENRRC